MKHFLLSLFFAAALFSAELRITSEDGFALYGWLDKPAASKKAAPLILFAHQFGSNHTIWNDLAKKFNAKGYATLNVDLRGHGKSIMQNGKENAVITDTRLDHIKEALVQSDAKVAFKKIPSDLMAWIELLGEDDSIDTDKLYLFGSSLGGGSIVSMSMTKQLYIVAKDDPLGAADRSIEYAKKAIAGTAIIISGDGHGTVLLPQVEDYIFAFMNSVK